MKPLALTIAFFCGIFLTLAFVGFSKRHQQDGYILEHEKDIAKEEGGSHDGGGLTTAYYFLSQADDAPMICRKRVLRKGSAIGYHLQSKHEIYYIVNGKGEMQMNGKTFSVAGGDIILTRPGNSHGLKQVGNDSLTVIINYLKQ